MTPPRRSHPKRRVGPALCLLAVLLLTGCFTHDTLVRVNPDGSGTVEQTVVFQGPMLEMMQSFGPSGAEGGMELYSMEELEEAAAEMGEDVRLVSVDSVFTETGGRGYTATYAFDDIRSLNINQSPTDDISTPSGGPGGMDMAEAESKDIRFDFSPGSPARLTIFVPPPDPDSLATQPADTVMAVQADSAQQAMQLAMLKQMLQGGGISLALEVNGSLQETNATHRDENRITLMAFDFDALLGNEEQLRTISTAQPKTVAEARALMEDIEGLTAEMQETVTVHFE